MGLQGYLTLAAVVFCIGLFGVITRRNAIGLLLGIELRLLTNVAGRDLPEDRDDVSMATLVPSFVLSELKQAFIIGFVIFIPFLVIDIVISGALMALGMMMMPPVMVSLPFKLLLFVLVDGWGLVITSVVSSYE